MNSKLKNNKKTHSFTLDPDVMKEAKELVTETSISQYINQLLREDLDKRRKEKVKKLIQELDKEVEKNPLTKEEYEYAHSILDR